jgi:transposase-like protein
MANGSIFIGQWTKKVTRLIFSFAPKEAVAAKAFFRKAFKENGRPDKVTVDKSGSNKAALDYFNKDVPKEEEIEVRQIKYLNNIAEQDHLFIKKRTRPTLGFKNFYSAKETIFRN